MIRTYKLVAFIACAAAGQCIAQEQPDTTKRYTSPEILVTSTRTLEPLSKAPMAISYVPASDFQTGRRYELKDALWSVPGVFTQARSGHTDVRITIRGYGARGAGNRSNAGNMRGIRVLLDGIPETEPDGRTSLDLVDLDAISHLEVLRSNSSTLYGSASGGVINLFTNLSFDQPFIETKNTVGSFNFLRNTVAAGTMFGTSRMFLSVTNTTYGEGDSTRRTFRDHSAASQFVVTLGLLSNLNESTDLGMYVGGTSNLFRFPGPITKAQFESDASQANAAFVQRDERRFNRQGRIAVTLDHRFPQGHELSGSVFYQPKVLERSERNTYRDFNRYGLGGQAQYQWAADFSPLLQSRFIASFDHQYQDGSVLFYSLAPGGGRGDQVSQDKQEGAITMGGYVEESLTLDSVWTLKVGGRYDNITYIFRNFLVPGSSGPPQRKEFAKFTPKAGLSYRIASGHSLYGAVGGGVEAPAFNEVDPPSDSLVRARGGEVDTVNTDFNPILDPATSTSFEIGARGLFGFDRLFSYLTYDVAAYMINLNNDLVPWDGGRYYFTAAETRRMGVEFGVSVGTTLGLSLQGALTVSQNTYLKYENQLGRFDGNEIAGLPSMFGSAKLRYDAPFGAFVEGSFDYVGAYYADDRNDEKPDGTPDASIDSHADAYSLLGLTVGWKHDFGPIVVDLYGTANNLADKRYISSVFINGEKNEYFEPGMPRSFVVGMGLRYK